jgi:hypothetical protein
MKFATWSLVVGLSVSGLSMLAGCDREVEHSESVRQNPDGSVTHKEDTVKKDANGDTITEHKSETN